MAYIVENDIIVAALTKQLDTLSGKRTHITRDFNTRRSGGPIRALDSCAICLIDAESGSFRHHIHSVPFPGFCLFVLFFCF